MKEGFSIQDIVKAKSYDHLLSNKESNFSSAYFQDFISQYFPKLFAAKESLDGLLHDQDFFQELQKIFQMHNELNIRRDELMLKNSSPSRQNGVQSIQAVSKKTRAALARRHEKNQQQMRKDQIFVRLTPKSQNCIQFMLCNRNFPRMQVKLSCNQHLQYLVNYLTNKWIRGKVGVKVVLYADNSFLKSVSLTQKQKAMKEPLNNYLMFTDIMTCCNVQQNGVLNMTYQIVQVKKAGPNAKVMQMQNIKQTNKGNQSLKLSSIGHFPKNRYHNQNVHEKSFRNQNRGDNYHSPSKYSYGKEQLIPEVSLFNKNSNIYGFNDESMFGSLGFNFCMASHKKQDPLFSLNSNPYHESFFPRSKESLPNLKEEEVQSLAHLSQKQEKSQGVFKKEEEDMKQNSHSKQNAASNREDPSKKLDNLMSLLDQIQKQKEPQQNSEVAQLQEANNSNRFKDVKTISIITKKRQNK